VRLVFGGVHRSGDPGGPGKIAMTRIALLHYSAPPIVGGVESVLGTHARLMADAGHEVRIVAGRGEQADPRIPFIHVPLTDSRHPEVLKLKTELDQGRVPSGFEELVAALTARLSEVLQDVKILIAHNVCSLNKNLVLTAAIKNLVRQDQLRIILWHHDLAWTTPRYRSELHDGYPWDLLRQAWPGVKQVTISEMRQRELAELFQIKKDEIAVVPNGVDAARFHKLEEQTGEYVRRLDLLNASPLLLLPVRITPRKNIELALHVCASLQQHFPDAKLIVTGPLGPHNPANIKYFEKLTALRQELKLDQAVCFLAELTDEYIPDEVISDFYHLADALFLPSREEGFGIPILEAGLAGLPIFCSDIPPLQSLGGSNVTYFSPEADPSELAAILAECLSSEAVFRMRTQVRREYTWERIYAQKIAPLLTE
ncbi:MAG TPA: glycosyltransferase family 4 protein, partial [Anaerolineae bacterium]|nr:glycosyltransferase family 4 protein [Anaerolineae bacterium]